MSAPAIRCQPRPWWWRSDTETSRTSAACTRPAGILAPHWSAAAILSCDWCRQYGEGAWEILEDCRRYINCSLQGDGSYLQHNMQCPGDLVFANEYGDCVEYDKATDCKVFQDTPCLHQVTRDNIPPAPDIAPAVPPHLPDLQRPRPGPQGQAAGLLQAARHQGGQHAGGVPEHEQVSR